METNRIKKLAEQLLALCDLHTATLSESEHKLAQALARYFMAERTEAQKTKAMREVAKDAFERSRYDAVHYGHEMLSMEKAWEKRRQDHHLWRWSVDAPVEFAEIYDALLAKYVPPPPKEKEIKPETAEIKNDEPA